MVTVDQSTARSMEKVREIAMRYGNGDPAVMVAIIKDLGELVSISISDYTTFVADAFDVNRSAGGVQ